MFFGFVAAPASATTIDLFDWGLNIDGALTLPGDPLPIGVDDSAFDFSTGLGLLQVTVAVAGAHNVDFFVDHEIDEVTNTFFNETGSTSGAPAAAGQSWEIDEPGYVTFSTTSHPARWTTTSCKIRMGLRARPRRTSPWHWAGILPLLLVNMP
jgi:hypothetical protein